MNSTAHPAVRTGHTLDPSSHDKATPAALRVQQAVARIEASRSALIVRLAPEPPRRRDDTSAGEGGSSAGGDDLSFVEVLSARIQRNGLVQGTWRTARTLARRWWTRQPWHSSVDLVIGTLAHEARPLMRSHPMATLVVGASLGAGLVALASAVHPWASNQIRGHGANWRSRVGNLLWKQINSAPVQLAVTGALAAWVTEQGIRRQAAAEAQNAPSGTASAIDQPHKGYTDAEKPADV